MKPMLASWFSLSAVTYCVIVSVLALTTQGPRDTGELKHVYLPGGLEIVFF